MGFLYCLFRGHKWKILSHMQHIFLEHLSYDDRHKHPLSDFRFSLNGEIDTKGFTSPLKGCQAECLKCGKKYDDITSTQIIDCSNQNLIIESRYI